MDRLQGRRLDGRYELLSRIGVGGMANVYKANDLLENRTVAVKILREELLENEELVRRFKNESRAISVLSHPNIVKVYDVSVTDALQYIVMEYLDGITLKDYMDQRPDLTWKEALHFITQLLAALEHAHGHGVVHRDIKPQNIMVLPDGSIKVMDFGIARISRAEQRTFTDKAIGSVHYISPEQAKGDVTDCKADIYSVGVMLYEMLTGRLPFESDTPVGVAIKQISDNPPLPREIKADIPEALEAITIKAMAKEPANRYQSAAAMLADIEEFKRNPSVSFEYKYFQDQSPTKMIDKVVGSQLTKKAAPKKKRTIQWNKKYTLPVMGGMAAAFAVGALILIFLIFKMSGNALLSSKEDVDLPDFTTMTRAEVEERLASGEYEFRITWQEIFNDDVTAGQIFDQSPKPPKQVKENARITLKVSKGVEVVTIPDVYGYTRSEAEKALSALGLNISVVPLKDTNAAENTVVRTEPERQNQVNSGTTVVVYVAAPQTSNQTYVPNVVGQLDLASAKKILENNGLIVGTRTTREDSAPAGTILEQSPAAGTLVSMGTQVNLVISSGAPKRSTVTVHVSFSIDIQWGTWNSSTGASFATTEGGARSWTFTSVGTAGPGSITVTGPGGVFKTIDVSYDGDHTYDIYFDTPKQDSGSSGGSSDPDSSGGGDTSGGDSSSGGGGSSGSSASTGGDSTGG